ncbi:helix-turn-helix domain-containing protein [Solihabitans fulvus]|uniref:Helix-turn-helix domain-containing protein n=1 Tax=Solihabitans fulvus TaxID=1892852 RepID=A0A5B2X4G5_9PSEU|nr:helix-turn-helix transcriptional regulator [Solihabitans fulvus]KAA2258124.1 helix-turn-helix domain-containing protein [Solihabitans fulvus]
MLYGRSEEQRELGRLLADARSGRSSVLVLRGEPGVGKTALLEHTGRTAADTGLRVLRGVGVETEAELPFAALHLLFRSVLDRIGTLPGPQASGLRGAFGLDAAPRADRFLIGLAVLTLLSELAEDGPLLCLVDDAQWLDTASAEALLFAARRLEAEGVALVFAARDEHSAFPSAGLPELRLHGLDQESSSVLLAEHAPDMPARLRDAVLAETGGNPLALIELAGRGVADSAAAGVFGLGVLPLPQRIQDAYRKRIDALPVETRTVLLVAACDDTGRLDVVLRAAATLWVEPAALAPAERVGLVTARGQAIEFRHPLVRTALRQGAVLSERLAAHRALARVLDGEQDVDLRAWQYAAAATGPDEPTASALERAAERARDRSGYGAVAAAYGRAAALSVDPVAKVRRLAVAAEASAYAGDVDQARALAAVAIRETTDPLMVARLAYVRATTQFRDGTDDSAFPDLVDAVVPIMAEHPRVADGMLAETIQYCWLVGEADLGRRATELLSRLSPDADGPMQLGQLLGSGLTVGWPPGDLERLRVWAERAETREVSFSHRSMLAALLLLTGDYRRTYHQAARMAADCRTHGVVGWLPLSLIYQSVAQLFAGLHRDALVSATEALRIARDTRQHHRAVHVHGVLAYVAARRGAEDECRAHANECLLGTELLRRAPGPSWAHAALSLLDLGAGRYAAVLDRLEALFTGPLGYQLPITRSMPDWIEAAVRLGRPDRAAEPLARLMAWVEHIGQDWADAVLARCRGLLTDGPAAEESYLAALALHGRDDCPFERGRTELVYGEWLRRQRRRAEARTQLGRAVEAFERVQAMAWADRARTELRATGQTLAPASGAANRLNQLTPQELQVVRLAATGVTNREIAAQLFLSPKTVSYHLYNAFPKLGVATRTELARLDLDTAARQA